MTTDSNWSSFATREQQIVDIYLHPLEGPRVFNAVVAYDLHQIRCEQNSNILMLG